MKARFLALSALVLGLASCQQDVELNNPVAVGGEVDFQLKVDAKELATRAGLNGEADEQNAKNSAYGAIDYYQSTDWSSVDLRYTLEVYDVAEDYTDAVPVKDRMVQIVDEYKPVAFDLRLVPNRNYHFVVFADFVPQGADATANIDTQRELGLRHSIGDNLGQISIKYDAINDESTDAYFATKDITISNSAAQDIVLQRPYGKIRVIATDLAELNTNVDPASVKVTYEAFHPMAFNAVNGKIGGEYETKEYTYAYADLYKDVKEGGLAAHYYVAGYDSETTTNVNGVKRHTKMTLFTDYILAEDEQSSIHFTMTVNDKAGNEIKTTNFSTDIPVERNHLTTIIGNVLTTATEINVTINDNFEGYHERNFVLVNTGKELKEAIDAYQAGQIILFDSNIAGNFTILQKEGINVIIDGNGYKFDGNFNVNGDARAAGEETLTFKNIKFETEKSDITFITAPSKIDNRYNYSHNVTIENCTFKGNHTVGCASFTGTYNFVMKNCKADNVHSIAQFQSVDNTVLVEDIKVTNSKNGISFGNTAFPTLKNAEIEAIEYGVRGDGDASRGNLVLENVKVAAKLPVIIRKVKTEGYSVEFSGDHLLEAPGYHIVFTKGADDAKVFEAPEVDFTVVGADNYNVFPGESLFAYNAESLQFFLDNAVNGDVIEIVKDIEGDVTVAQKPDTNITINGKDFNYAGSIVVDGKSATYTTAGLTIMSLNFVADSISADACIRLGNGENNTRYTCNVTVKGCTFDVPGAVGVKSYTGGDKNLKIANCTATVNAHSLLQAKGIDGIRVEGCTVNSKNGLNFNNSNNVVVSACNTDVRGYAVRFGEGSAATGAAETYTIENSTLKSTCEEAGDAVIVLRGSADKATLKLVNTTIEGNPQILNNAAEAKVLVENEEVVTSADALKAALANGGTITLGTNVEGTFTIKKENTKIIGVNGATITGRVNVSNCDGTVFENLKFKINDASKHKNTFSGAPYHYPGIVVAYGAQMTFEGCEFESSIATGVCGINAGNHADSTDKLTVNNCKFVGDFYAIRTRTLFEITNNKFDIYTNQGTLAAVWTWGNANSGANTVTFTGNTNVNTNKVYGVQMTASNFVYDYITINVQDNTNFHALADGINPARFNGTHTFVEGSETF